MTMLTGCLACVCLITNSNTQKCEERYERWRDGGQRRDPKSESSLKVPKWVGNATAIALAPTPTRPKRWRRKVIGGYWVPCKSAHCTLETALRYVTRTSWDD